MIGLASLNFFLIAVHLVLVVSVSIGCFFAAVVIASFQGERYRIGRHGVVKALTRPRLWELLALTLIFGYLVGVLLFAKALLLPNP